jgi:activator of HSP90 ATPase
MTYDFELSDELPANPQRIFDTWMSSEDHTAMTGGTAELDPRIGGAFSAWDGYIVGQTTALEPGRRIVQSWRTAEFSETEADSQIEIVLEPVEAGTRITLIHSTVPDRLRSFQEGGWQTHYFDPMRTYFAAA